MKIFLRVFVAAVLLIGIANAASGDIRDVVANIDNEIPFGYTTNQQISVSQIATDKIVISSPVIKDEFLTTITKYTVMFSQYSLSQILDNPTLLSQSKEKNFDFPTVGTGVTMELKASEHGINPNVFYYLVVIPKDQNGILGEISNEIRFKLATKTFGEGIPSTTGSHGVAGANMTLAHVSHTIAGNKATLTRTAIDGSDKVDIFLWNTTSLTFDRLTSINMSAEKYQFTLTRNGEYLINFMPNNGGTEYRYTFVADGIVAPITPSTSKPVKPVIGKIPATGPKENVLVALGIALILYIAYRKIRAKH